MPVHEGESNCRQGGLILKSVLTIIIIVSMTTSALAQAPKAGVYTSTDLGGTVLTGRYSKSWSHPTGYASLGNTLNIQSWDGSTLGSQWSIVCPAVDYGILISDSIDSDGLHHAVGLNEYTTCTVTLNGTGSWGGGEPSYSFEMRDYQEIVRIISTDTEILEITYEGSGHGLLATEQYHASIFLYSLFRYEVDNTDNEHHHPSDFPAIVSQSCEPGPQLGVWGNATGIHFEIYSTVPTEQTTWGKVKSLYRTRD